MRSIFMTGQIGPGKKNFDKQLQWCYHCNYLCSIKIFGVRPVDFLKKISPTYAYQAVSNQLEEAIVSGKIKPGDKLPSERDLIDHLSTSRRTLREAFRILEQKGLIEIKIGSKGGTYVADHVGERLVETLSLFVRRQEIPEKDLAEFRALTESAVVKLVAERASEEQFDMIGSYVSQIEELLHSKSIDKKIFVDKELELHAYLAKICGNSMYVPVLHTINDLLLRQAFLLDHIDTLYIQKALDDWRAILLALRSRTPGKASSLIQEHILTFADSVTK